MNQEPLIALRNPLRSVGKAGALTLPIFFVTSKFSSLSYIAMCPALKAFARGTLTFLEIIIVVTFIASLAAIAALSSLWARKRNRTPKVPNVLCFTDSATDQDAA
jgi:hypothetical protein